MGASGRAAHASRVAGVQRDDAVRARETCMLRGGEWGMGDTGVGEWCGEEVDEGRASSPADDCDGSVCG